MINKFYKDILLMIMHRIPLLEDMGHHVLTVMADMSALNFIHKMTCQNLSQYKTGLK